MASFTPCLNRNACNEDGFFCRACGRSHNEIREIRDLTSKLAEFIKRMEYDNPQEFLAYVARKVEKKAK